MDISYEDAGIDLFKSEIGQEFRSLEFTIEEETVDKLAWANDDYNPWNMETSPWGGRIAQPSVIAPYSAWLFGQQFLHTEEGGIHAKTEYEFINPLIVGRKLTMKNRLVERYFKRGRHFFVTEHLVVDETGKELIRELRTSATPAVVKSTEA